MHEFHHISKEAAKRLSALLEQPQTITVVSHSNPDGDAVGSCLSLLHFLRIKGHEVTAMLPNAFPEFLAWMPGADDILLFDDQTQECVRRLEKSTLIICVDFNDLNRTAEMEFPIRNSKAVKVLIDHHIQPSTEFDILFSVIPVSSTSELIYHLMHLLNCTNCITREIAESLFVGIMTDTGSFSYSCNYVHTFEVVAKLIQCGLDAQKVHQLVYDTYSESRMRLIGHCLSDRLVVINRFSTAYIYLSADDLEKFNYQIGDTEGVVNYALAIKGIRFAAIFTERDGYIRVSLRSKGDFSVNDFARNHYEGGGHKNAAGGNSYLSMQETLSRFESLLPLYAENLNQNTV